MKIQHVYKSMQLTQRCSEPLYCLGQSADHWRAGMCVGGVLTIAAAEEQVAAGVLEYLFSPRKSPESLCYGRDSPGCLASMTRLCLF